MTIIGQGIPQIIGMLGLASGVANSRVVRAAVIGIEGNPYFEAAHAIGSPSWRTLLRHVWPNITAPIIIIYSITIGWAIIAEASLSFLGFGLPPDVPSWGTMLSREGRQYMEMAPRLAMWPGVALTLVVYCLNMVGDALRDLLDPRLRGGGGALAGGVARAPPSAPRRPCRSWNVREGRPPSPSADRVLLLASPRVARAGALRQFMTIGSGRFRMFCRARKTSTACWAFSQNSGDVSRARANLMASSALIDVRPLTIRLITFTSQPMCSASCLCVM